MVLIVLSLTFSFLTAFKDELKMDEPLVLDFIFNGILQPDHQPLYYRIASFWGEFFGLSNLSLRMPSLIFFCLGTIVFYSWLKKRMNQLEVFWATILLVTNFYLLNQNVYAYEYALYFLISILSFHVFENYLESNTKINFFKLAIVNTLGIFCFIMYYHIIVAQLIFVLTTKRRKENLFFIFFAAITTLTHFILFSIPAVAFRLPDKANREGDRSFFEFLCDLAGIHTLQGNFYNYGTYISLVVVLGLFIFCLWHSSWYSGRQFWGRRKIEGFFLTLFVVSVVSFTLFKILNLREIEYRYFFYLTPIFIFFFLVSLRAMKSPLNTLLLAVLIGINCYNLNSFLSTQSYGHNRVLLKFLKQINENSGSRDIYTNNLWNLKHLVLPAFQREFPREDLKLNFLEFQNIKDIKYNSFQAFLYAPDLILPEEMESQFVVKNYQQFFCKNCDCDALQYYNVIKK